MSGDAVLYERKGHTAYITLNRPEKLNAVNGAVSDGLVRAWREFSLDEEAWLAVLTGSGDRAFCAGVDLRDPGPTLPIVPGIGVEIWKPIIAAVRGHCLGIGLVLAMYCDIRIASEDARFGYPEARVGVTGGVGATLIRHMPRGVAMELLFTAESMDARRAYEIGFVNRVVPPGKLMGEAADMAEKINRNAPLVVRALKELAHRDSHPTLREAQGLAERILEPVRSSRDALEGPKAFAEKRAPRFRAR